MPSEWLDKSNHTDKQSNETSSTICTPTSSPSTITGSKSIDASDSKFNYQEHELKIVAASQEMKSKSLPLRRNNDTVIYRLKPKEDWHEAKVTRRGDKAIGLHSSWFNVKSMVSDEQYSIDFENVE